MVEAGRASRNRAEEFGTFTVPLSVRAFDLRYYVAIVLPLRIGAWPVGRDGNIELGELVVNRFVLCAFPSARRR